ncbi:hypothetical protein [Moorena sp. SIO4A5]|nr:hypothetical protein [Moorena sp. SIO4A5]
MIRKSDFGGGVSQLCGQCNGFLITIVFYSLFPTPYEVILDGFEQ